MSLAELQQNEIAFPKAQLSVTILRTEPTSSIASSQASSPTGNIDSGATASSSTTSASCTSLPIRSQTQNVKFAPLPQLAPRKRRSTAPLGMAARTQLVRRRRGYYDPDPGPRYNQNSNPMWTEEELAEARVRQVAAAMEKEKQRREQAAREDEEDPFLALGRLVKGASKQIWRKVSSKEKKEKDKSVEGDGTRKRSGSNASAKDVLSILPQQEGSTLQESEEGTANILSELPSSKEDDPPLRLLSSDLVEEPEEEDQVWEEGFLLIGQTDTFVEGRTQFVKTTKLTGEDSPKNAASSDKDQATTLTIPPPPTSLSPVLNGP